MWQGHFAKHARHDPRVTHSEVIAIALLMPATVLSATKAPLVSLAFVLTFTANLAYANGIVQEESLRWISTVTGLAGAVEFGRGVERVLVTKPESIPSALRKIDAGAWMGLVVLASMAVDGLGWIVERKLGVWVVPEMTIGILILVCGIGVFGREVEQSV
jgi:hypothetical protein